MTDAKISWYRQRAEEHGFYPSRIYRMTDQLHADLEYQTKETGHGNTVVPAVQSADVYSAGDRLDLPDAPVSGVRIRPSDRSYAGDGADMTQRVTIGRLSSGYWHVRFSAHQFVQCRSAQVIAEDGFGWLTEEQLRLASRLIAQEEENSTGVPKP